MTKLLTSPIRWSGSKRKIIKHILPLIDATQDCYVEPFLGSATMLINILPKNYYKEYFVNDINSDLINFFIQLRDTPDSLIEQIFDISKNYNSFPDIEKKQGYYYELRSYYNNFQMNKITRASFFWFLTKTCFNGVYRVNKQGKYNVPFGKKEKANFDLELFFQISSSIKNVSFSNLDYLDFLRQLANKDLLQKSFIYLDPPYMPETAQTQKQKIYTSNFFQHDRFSDFIDVIYENIDLSLMLSMSDSSYSQKIYDDLSLNKKKVVDIVRVVNPKALLSSSEVIYTNYKVDNDE
ncbi:DNA adenine methylase [Enterococcus thailandicus]|uniref:DNA adenine methylase n=1 Tax=Enterococcus TaxID=1350 RepID=UPI0022E3E290|nr:DNA adenine methylase [Enterococcus thailandicus]